METSIKHLSYYQTGGTVEKLYEPLCKAELQAACREIKTQNLPYFVLGGGTNSLVCDTPFLGAVISLGHMSHIKNENSKLICEAGATNTAIAEFALENHLEGAAWMNYLPGQIGGTTRMNARCYGGEISQIASHILTVDESGEEQVYAGGTQTFQGYKNTIFMTLPVIIYEVHLDLLKTKNVATIIEKMNFCRDDRISKSQFLFPSCGCVFKNNYAFGIPSGVLLDAAGAKDLSFKGAKVNPHHANFIFNHDDATSDAILQLSFLMRNAVHAEFGIWLEYEMEILGTLSETQNNRFFERKPNNPNIKFEALKQKISKK